MPPIALIGLPGAGKSSVGRQLARRLGVDFVDADTVIEQRIGMPIRAFFEQHGEARFREIEQAVLAELLAGGTSSGATSGTTATIGDTAGASALAAMRGTVLATGGGVVLREANRRVLRERATVLYLRASLEELHRRLKRDTQRPLLQVRDPRAQLKQLHRERDPLYRETAHFVIETGRPSAQSLVGMVLMQLELAGLVDPTRVPATVDGPPVASASGVASDPSVHWLP